ncbi:hypothetical protein [Methanolapillus millepedarum]|uniref:Uncharacterized protein n=1 Tax=Methanolapillus millepedarum TaxID=3028296 RepID=A0AA96V2V5_9EURY|nr:hypothetical protein MsAc7_04390 [Methanosarcinaceae archaeon Ac7]
MKLSIRQMTTVELFSTGLIFMIISAGIPLIFSFLNVDPASPRYFDFILLQYATWFVSMILFFTGILLILSSVLSKTKK